MPDYLNTVKQLKDALSEYPDDTPLIGLFDSLDSKESGLPEDGAIYIYRPAGDIACVCVVVHKPPQGSEDWKKIAESKGPYPHIW